MKGNRLKKEVKTFGLIVLFAVLSAIPRKYIPETMFSDNQLLLLMFIVGMVLLLKNESDKVTKNQISFWALIFLELAIVSVFTLILSILVEWTFLQLFPLFLFVYFVFRMFQAPYTEL